MTKHFLPTRWAHLIVVAALVVGVHGACAQTVTGAAVSPPPASTTEPSLILNSQINSGDTAWMLASMALVLMMTVPGLALFYGGMVRKKNVLATLMHSATLDLVLQRGRQGST